MVLGPESTERSERILSNIWFMTILPTLICHALLRVATVVVGRDLPTASSPRTPEAHLVQRSTRDITPGDSRTKIEFCAKGHEGHRGPIASACPLFYTSLSLYLYIHIYTYIPYSPERCLKPGVFKRCVQGTVKGTYGERGSLP